MASMIVSAKNFSPSANMIYRKPKVNQQGGKSVGIMNSMSKKALYLEVPLMMTWGVNVYDNTGGNSYDLSLQFPPEEFAEDDCKETLKILQEFEDKIKDDATKNSRDWFGKQSMSPEVIDALWSPMLKYPKDSSSGEPDKTRSPTLKVKLPYWENDFKFELFDTEHKPLIPNDENNGPEVFIQKGSHIACILLCGGIWFANGKFGVTWKLFQGVSKPTVTLEKGKCHITKESSNYDSDGEEEQSMDTKEETQKETQEEVQEEEPQEEVQEEPQEEEPPQKGKKAKTKKK